MRAQVHPMLNHIDGSGSRAVFDGHPNHVSGGRPTHRPWHFRTSRRFKYSSTRFWSNAGTQDRPYAASPCSIPIVPHLPSRGRFFQSKFVGFSSVRCQAEVSLFLQHHQASVAYVLCYLSLTTPSRFRLGHLARPHQQF